MKSSFRASSASAEASFSKSETLSMSKRARRFYGYLWLRWKWQSGPGRPLSRTGAACRRALEFASGSQSSARRVPLATSSPFTAIVSLHVKTSKLSMRRANGSSNATPAASRRAGLQRAAAPARDPRAGRKRPEHRGGSSRPRSIRRDALCTGGPQDEPAAAEARRQAHPSRPQPRRCHVQSMRRHGGRRQTASWNGGVPEVKRCCRCCGEPSWEEGAGSESLQSCVGPGCIRPYISLARRPRIEQGLRCRVDLAF